jgi:predicted TIM-barrel fold metal-dependent hydrolase
MGGPGAERRRRTRQPQGGWWGSPVRHVRDLAASMSPRLLGERLPEIGFDYSVLYPTNALGAAGHDDPELRTGLCRGLNDFLAATYGPYADRYTVAGMIPMHTPEEAIAELEHCRAIGLKVVGIATGVLRPIEAPAASPWLLPGQTHWWDFFGLDSLHDYDPVWRRFADLGFAVTVHWGVGGPPVAPYHSITSWMANHIGSFAAVTAPTVKALYLGGVTRRLPDVVFAFQECGAGWVPGLLADTIEHWEKRNLARVREVYDPALLDLDALVQLVAEWSPELAAAVPEGELADALRSTMLGGDPPDELDEWIALGVEREDDLGDLLTRNFYFGCEADDRGVASAFAPANALGAEVKVVLGSDISHFDVPDFDRVLPDAFALVDRGLLTPEQFRRFTCDNIAELLLRADPGFFEGTAVAGAVGVARTG